MRAFALAILVAVVLPRTALAFTEVFSLTEDSAGNSYYVGNSDSNFFIGKRNANCAAQWTSTDGSTEGDAENQKFTEILYSVVVGDDGLLYTAGSTRGNFSAPSAKVPNIDAAIVVYNPQNGAALRQKQYDVASGYDNVASAVKQKPDGNLLVSVYGSVPTTVNGALYETRLLEIDAETLVILNIYTLTVSTTGIFGITGGPKILDFIYDEFSDSIVALGHILGRGILWRYSLADEIVTAQAEWGSTIGSNEVEGLASDGEGAFYVVGYSGENVLDNTDLVVAVGAQYHAYVIRFDDMTEATTTSTWVRQLAVPGSSQSGNDIDFNDVSRQLTVIGSFDESFEVTDTQTSRTFQVDTITDDGFTDIFIWTLNASNGDFEEMRISMEISTAAEDKGNALQVLTSGRLDIGGLVNDGDETNPVFCDRASISESPTPSPSMSQSETPSPSLSSSVTPSISATPSVTPSISVTSSVTPSLSVTPSVTPSVSTSSSITPSITPSSSPPPSVSGTASITSTPSALLSEVPGASVTPSLFASVSPTSPEGQQNGAASSAPSEDAAASSITTVSPLPSDLAVPFASTTPSTSDFSTTGPNVPALSVSATLSGSFSASPVGSTVPQGTAVFSSSLTLISATPFTSVIPSNSVAAVSLSSPTPSSVSSSTLLVIGTATSSALPFTSAIPVIFASSTPSQSPGIGSIPVIFISATPSQTPFQLPATSIDAEESISASESPTYSDDFGIGELSESSRPELSLFPVPTLDSLMASSPGFSPDFPEMSLISTAEAILTPSVTSERDMPSLFSSAEATSDPEISASAASPTSTPGAPLTVPSVSSSMSPDTTNLILLPTVSLELTASTSISIQIPEESQRPIESSTSVGSSIAATSVSDTFLFSTTPDATREDEDMGLPSESITPLASRLPVASESISSAPSFQATIFISSDPTPEISSDDSFVIPIFSRGPDSTLVDPTPDISFPSLPQPTGIDDGKNENENVDREIPSRTPNGEGQASLSVSPRPSSSSTSSPSLLPGLSAIQTSSPTASASAGPTTSGIGQGGFSAEPSETGASPTLTASPEASQSTRTEVTPSTAPFLTTSQMPSLSSSQLPNAIPSEGTDDIDGDLAFSPTQSPAVSKTSEPSFGESAGRITPESFLQQSPESSPGAFMTEITADVSPFSTASFPEPDGTSESIITAESSPEMSSAFVPTESSEATPESVWMPTPLESMQYSPEMSLMTKLIPSTEFSPELSLLPMFTASMELSPEMSLMPVVSSSAEYSPEVSAMPTMTESLEPSLDARDEEEESRSPSRSPPNSSNQDTANSRDPQMSTSPASTTSNSVQISTEPGSTISISRSPSISVQPGLTSMEPTLLSTPTSNLAATSLPSNSPTLSAQISTDSNSLQSPDGGSGEIFPRGSESASPRPSLDALQSITPIFSSQPQSSTAPSPQRTGDPVLVVSVIPSAGPQLVTSLSPPPPILTGSSEPQISLPDSSTSVAWTPREPIVLPVFSVSISPQEPTEVSSSTLPNTLPNSPSFSAQVSVTIGPSTSNLVFTSIPTDDSLSPGTSVSVSSTPSISSSSFSITSPGPSGVGVVATSSQRLPDLDPETSTEPSVTTISVLLTDTPTNAPPEFSLDSTPETTGDISTEPSFAAYLKPSFEVTPATSFEVSFEPSIDGSTAPSLEVSAAPSLEVSAAPSLEVSAAPSLEVSAAPSLEVSAAPSLEISAAPSFEVSPEPSPGPSRESPYEDLPSNSPVPTRVPSSSTNVEVSDSSSPQTTVRGVPTPSQLLLPSVRPPLISESSVPTPILTRSSSPLGENTPSLQSRPTDAQSPSSSFVTTTGSFAPQFSSSPQPLQSAALILQSPTPSNSALPVFSSSTQLPLQSQRPFGSFPVTLESPSSSGSVSLPLQSQTISASSPALSVSPFASKSPVGAQSSDLPLATEVILPSQSSRASTTAPSPSSSRAEFTEVPRDPFSPPSSSGSISVSPTASRNILSNASPSAELLRSQQATRSPQAFVSPQISSFQEGTASAQATPSQVIVSSQQATPSQQPTLLPQESISEQPSLSQLPTKTPAPNSGGPVSPNSSPPLLLSSSPDESISGVVLVPTSSGFSASTPAASSVTTPTSGTTSLGPVSTVSASPDGGFNPGSISPSTSPTVLSTGNAQLTTSPRESSPALAEQSSTFTPDNGGGDSGDSLTETPVPAESPTSSASQTSLFPSEGSPELSVSPAIDPDIMASAFPEVTVAFSPEAAMSLEPTSGEFLAPTESEASPESEFSFSPLPSKSSIPSSTLSSGITPTPSPSGNEKVPAFDCVNRANITDASELLATDHLIRVSMVIQIAGPNLTNACGLNTQIAERFISLSAANTLSEADLWFVTLIEDGPPVYSSGSSLVSIDELENLGEFNDSSTPSPSPSPDGDNRQLFAGSVVFAVTAYFDVLTTELSLGSYVEYIDSQNIVEVMQREGFQDIEWTGMVVDPIVLDARTEEVVEETKSGSLSAGSISGIAVGVGLVAGIGLLVFKDAIIASGGAAAGAAGAAAGPPVAEIV